MAATKPTHSDKQISQTLPALHGDRRRFYVDMGSGTDEEVEEAAEAMVSWLDEIIPPPSDDRARA